ncbi:MAG TPA: FGGY family carbohydrate kinase, partial [Arenibaculum sp.]|nr:FGGY family carbohydrate kinase [Arenibaculum sp.]
MTAAGRNEAPTHVAVLDIGKTNVKLNAVTSEGAVLETLSTPNPSLDGPPYRHHDLATLECWLMDGLADLGRRHPLGAFVACGHGSGGVLVDDDGPVAPMIDYEQPIPEHVGRAYADLAGPFEERGSAVMLGATHLARQMLWLETDHAQAFRRARWFLGLPQYWAWRLTGSAASEVTILAAQSNIWNVPGRRFTEIVRSRGWERLLPPFVPAWRTVGPLRPGLARRLGLAADLKVLCGIHDSSANFYRYQAAGLGGMTVVSTGTWIVGFSDDCDLSVLSEERGMTCNADIMGNPLAGVLTMAGREFALVAGDSAAGPNADPDELAWLVDAGTMALPSFGGEDGLFPGSAGRGRIVGPPPATPQARRALAVLYMALLTDVCLDALC